MNSTTEASLSHSDARETDAFRHLGFIDLPLSLRRLVIALVFALFGLAGAVPAKAVWVGKNSQNQTVTVDLKSAGPSNFSVLAVGNSNNLLDFGGGTFDGNIGDAHINPVLSGGTINGNVYLGNGIDSSNFIGHGTISGTVFTNQDAFLTQPLADANAAFSAALTLKATQALSTINDAWFGGLTTKTITGIAGTNVLNLSGINLTQGETLKLSAPAGGSFVLVVNGAVNLSSGASIVVDTTSGLAPLDVLYALGGGSFAATGTANRSSIIDGIVMVNQGNFNITQGQVNGEVIGGCDLVFSQSRTTPGFSPIPETSTFLPLLGVLSIATGGQLLTRRRNAPPPQIGS